MKPCNPAVVVLVLLGMGVATPGDAAQRHMWWQSDEVRAELDLTDDQAAALHGIFQTALPDLRRLMHELRQEEEELSDLITAAEADEWEVTLQIDKVEAARSALGKTRTLMLYRKHRELSGTQRTRCGNASANVAGGVSDIRQKAGEQRRPSPGAPLRAGLPLPSARACLRIG